MRDEIYKIQDYERELDYIEFFRIFEREIKDRFESSMVSYPGDARMIEALINLTMSRNVLEIGMYTGFTTLHMLRAIWGRGKVTAIDCALHGNGGMGDTTSIFLRDWIQTHFRFVHGKTPEIMGSLAGELFDLVYFDSDHSLAVTEAERLAVWPLTQSGTVFVYHDCPKRDNLNSPELGTIYRYLMGLVQSGVYEGLILPSQDRIDVRQQLGEKYHRDFLPHLGIFIRK